MELKDRSATDLLECNDASSVLIAFVVFNVGITVSYWVVTNEALFRCMLS